MQRGLVLALTDLGLCLPLPLRRYLSQLVSIAGLHSMVSGLCTLSQDSFWSGQGLLDIGVVSPPPPRAISLAMLLKMSPALL